MQSEAVGYATLIQPEAIKDITVEKVQHSTDGHSPHTACGTLTFRVNRFLAGRVQFMAVHAPNGAWSIREFSVPEWGVTTTLNDAGRWRIVHAPPAIPSAKPPVSSGAFPEGPPSPVPGKNPTDFFRRGPLEER
jgi:hypothetical protein